MRTHTMSRRAPKESAPTAPLAQPTADNQWLYGNEWLVFAPEPGKIMFFRIGESLGDTRERLRLLGVPQNLFACQGPENLDRAPEGQFTCTLDTASPSVKPFLPPLHPAETPLLMAVYDKTGLRAAMMIVELAAAEFAADYSQVVSHLGEVLEPAGGERQTTGRFKKWIANLADREHKVIAATYWEFEEEQSLTAAVLRLQIGDRSNIMMMYYGLPGR